MYEFFWQKIEKIWKLEKLENMPSSQKWEAAKYAGGSRPSCFNRHGELVNY